VCTKMAADRNDTAAKSEAMTSPSSAQLQDPVAPWILNSLNQVHSKIDGLGQDMKGIEKRLQRLENHAHKVLGAVWAVGVILVVIELLLSIFDITITPKP